MFIYSILRYDTNLSVKLMMILGFVLAATTAIVMHEISHGFVALKLGDDTAKVNGRLSLNPTAHFDLIGFVMFFVVGFGWAKPVPINSSKFKKYSKNNIRLVSLSGVITNITLALISCLFMFLTMLIFTKMNLSNSVVQVFYMLFRYFFEFSIIMNFMLAFFNILPFYPLDGFNLLSTFTKYDSKTLEFLRLYGFYILLGLIILGNFFNVLNIFGYVQSWVYQLINAIIKAALTINGIV